MTDTARGDTLPAIDPGGWAPYLDEGEKLLWTGQPEPGLRFRGANVVKSVFGLFFLGFSVFWVVMAMTITGAGAGAFGTMGLVFPLFGLPFVAVGLYLVVGHFFWEAYVRKHTRYALTGKRAFIATAVFGRKLKSYPVTKSMPLEFEPGPPDTIWFAEEDRRGSKGRRYTVKRGFEMIADGDEVYRLIRRIRGEA